MFGDHEVWLNGVRMGGGETFYLNDVFNTLRAEDATLTMPLDQFETIREGLDPESYVINLEEGDDGVWRAESVTIKIVLHHQA
jgi:hypothetical protein